jgi:hypothetical protein
MDSESFTSKTQARHLPVAIRVDEIQRVALIDVQAFLKSISLEVFKLGHRQDLLACATSQGQRVVKVGILVSFRNDNLHFVL